MKNVCVLGCGRLGQIIADGLHTGKVERDAGSKV